jgi:hypothetical protein
MRILLDEAHLEWEQAWDLTRYSKPAFTAHLAHPHEAAEIDRLIAHGLPAAQRANTPQFAWPASCGGFRRGWGGWGWGLPLAGVGYVLVLLGPLRRMGRLHLGSTSAIERTRNSHCLKSPARPVPMVPAVSSPARGLKRDMPAAL